MRAAIFQEVGRQLAIVSVKDPAPAEGEVVIRVHRCGICGSDLHLTEGHGYKLPSGTVLGHEFTGEVVAVGRGVDRFKCGDRIAAMPVFGCGHCRYCLAGEPAWCAQIGYTFGGYAEYAAVNAGTALRLPKTLSLADGALAEPLAVALHGVAAAGVTPGASVLVLGAGPIGLAALFWARRLGAGRVDVIEGAPPRADIALAMGADSVRPPTTQAAAELGNHDTGDKPSLVIECVGRPGLLGQAVEFVQRRGTVVSLGYCFQPDTLVPAFAGSKEITLLFPQLYTTREFEVAIEVLDAGAVGPREMVTSTIGFTRLPAVFEGLRRVPQECKVLIDPALT